VRVAIDISSCPFCPYVFRWSSSYCSSLCLSRAGDKAGAREARLNPELLLKTAPPSAEDISLLADELPFLLLHLLTWWPKVCLCLLFLLQLCRGNRAEGCICIISHASERVQLVEYDRQYLS